jgi:HlyD family secretion protein
MTANKKTAPNEPALQALLGEDHSPKWWKRTSLWLVLGALVLLGVGYSYWQSQNAAKAAPAFVTETARKGQLTLTVSANGTLQPTRSVNVGSELSGTVQRVLVDVNDQVKVGQVMVELDTAKFNDQVQRSRASLAAAQAQLAQSEATVKESQATLARFEEVAKLSGGKVPSATELDSARASVDRAVAAKGSAEANVAVARANLSTDVTNLSKASIRSPIDGVVLSRSVDPGNAVAASLQAVTLFSVAENLTQLELSASVDEADVGAVKVGQKATFTRVAFGATTTNNVVTYTATLEVDNSDLSLRPGMTAVATIVATERTDALLVPNTALRFTPTVNSTAKAASGGSILSKMMPRPPRSSATKKTTEEKAAPGARKIWVLENGEAKPMTVQTGISDGRMTEILGGNLTAGMEVITDQRAAGAGS